MEKYLEEYLNSYSEPLTRILRDSHKCFPSPARDYYRIISVYRGCPEGIYLLYQSAYSLYPPIAFFYTPERKVVPTNMIKEGSR